jgi:hypothetical protein
MIGHVVLAVHQCRPRDLEDRRGTAVRTGHRPWTERLCVVNNGPSAVERGRVLGDLLEEPEARILEEVGDDD